MTKTIDHFNWAKSRVRDYTHFSPREIIGGYAARYPAASDFTFTYEGGYVNDPDDPGGCTNMGITIGTLRGWRSDDSLTCNDVKALSYQEAALIYATNYWAPVWGNKLPVGVNTQVYDWGVNSGPRTSVMHLQRIVGTTDDGAMGPNTLAAVNAYVDKATVQVLLDQYHAERQRYYESLSSFSKYGNGWTARNDACLELSSTLASTTIELPSLPIPAPDGGDTDQLNKRMTALETWAQSFKALE